MQAGGHSLLHIFFVCLSVRPSVYQCGDTGQRGSVSPSFSVSGSFDLIKYIFQYFKH
jgi:hypothetical protein